MANIFDVAKRAGVSIKTVSRVMNDQSAVRAATRDRVLKAMKELDYNPSHAARELRSGRSRSIGMLFGDPSSGFQSRFHHAALQACDEVGYFLAAGLFDERADDWDKQLSAFLARTRVKNMILVPPLCGSTVLHNQLIEHGVSFVLISPTHPVDGVPSISMDDFQAAQEITAHLLELGHRRIGHISGDADHIASKRRREGYQAALAAVPDAVLEDKLIQPGGFSFDEALGVAEAMLSGPNRPTAIFASNDEMAAAVYFVANRLDLRVPEDLSVVGFDDIPLARTIWPPLTTVAQPYEAMTREAVRKLAKAEGKAGPVDVTLGYELKIRQSTAPAPQR